MYIRVTSLSQYSIWLKCHKAILQCRVVGLLPRKFFWESMGSWLFWLSKSSIEGQSTWLKLPLKWPGSNCSPKRPFEFYSVEQSSLEVDVTYSCPFFVYKIRILILIANFFYRYGVLVLVIEILGSTTTILYGLNILFDPVHEDLPLDPDNKGVTMVSIWNIFCSEIVLKLSPRLRRARL